MSKKFETYILSFFILFIIYCAIISGSFWDENFEMTMGKERLKYLFSLGDYKNYDFYNSRFYPGFYNTIAAFLTKMFPAKFESEIWRISNASFSVLAIFGIYKIVSNLFNKHVGKIVFVLTILNPVFFGHMIMNSKDTVLVFAHVWTTYLFIKYLQNQNNKEKIKRYVLLAGLSVGLGTGIRFPFLVTLFPLFIFSIFDIFFLKKIICKNFSFTKFLFHLILILITSYFVAVSFWPHVHSNIFVEPFKLLMTQINGDVFGVQWILFNGLIYDTKEMPYYYLITHFFYKSPEFLLLGFFAFTFFLISNRKFFFYKFNHFFTKIILILFIILFPLIYFIFLPYRVYDGLRLFLYIIPYFCIIPGIGIYYCIKNFHSSISKAFAGGFFFLFIYFLFIFFTLTPFQYTYLNLFAGDYSKANQKFENDYLSISIKELINKIPSETNLLSSNQKIKLSFCGVSHMSARKELDKLNSLKYEIKDLQNNDFDYVIMTNRAVENRNNNTIDSTVSCFDKINGENLIEVRRRGLLLSTLRKVN